VWAKKRHPHPFFSDDSVLNMFVGFLPASSEVFFEGVCVELSGNICTEILMTHTDRDESSNILVVPSCGNNFLINLDYDPITN
jgi:hypothetical protein